MPIVELTIDASGSLTGATTYDQATQKISNSTQKAESSLDKMRKGVNKLGPMFLAAGAVVGTAIVGIGAKAIEAASAMEETQNKFDVVFKGMESSAEAWAQHLRQNYLMTSQEAKQFLASTQDLLKPMGVAAEQAGEMSFEVAKLATDLGSFNDMNTADVMNDIQSALVGNGEAMKKYGVIVNETTIKANAYATGLAEVGTELTTAQKAQSALDLIMKGSADAQGDAARSAGSYANQMKLLQSNFGELLITLGEKFLPIVTEVITKINEWFTNQENLNRVINAGVETVRFMYNAYQGIVIALKAVVVAIAKFAETTVKAFRIVMKPIDLLFKGIEKLGGPKNPFGIAQEAMEAFSASAIENLQSTWQNIEDGNKYFDGMRQKTEEVKESTDELSGSLSDASLAGGELNDSMLETGNAAADAAEKIHRMTGAVSTVTEVTIENGREITRVFEMMVNSAGEWERSLVSQSSAVIENETAAKAAATATNSYKAAVDQLAGGARQATGAVRALSAAQSAVASTTGGGTGGAGAPAGAGGGGGGGGGGSSSSGVWAMPEWFTAEMTKQWNKDYREKYLHNQDYIFNPLIKGRAQGELNILKNFDLWARANFGVTSDSFAHTQGTEITGQNGVTVNVNQSMSKSEIADLISELQRAGARG